MGINIGTDICDPKRIEKTYTQFGSKFIKRIFTENEIKELEEHLKSSDKSLLLRLAGRYAAKEAIAKVFGTGIGEKLGFHDVEVCRCKESGKPLVNLSEKAQKLAESLEFKEVKVSISHEKAMVVATAISV